MSTALRWFSIGTMLEAGKHLNVGNMSWNIDINQYWKHCLEFSDKQDSDTRSKINDSPIEQLTAYRKFSVET